MKSFKIAFFSFSFCFIQIYFLSIIRKILANLQIKWLIKIKSNYDKSNHEIVKTVMDEELL